MKEIKQLLGIIAVLAVIIISYTIFSKAGETVMNAQMRSEVQTNMQTEFMESCVETPAYYRYCDCAFNYGINKLGVNGFVKMAMEFEQTGEYTPDIMEMAYACMHHL